MTEGKKEIRYEARVNKSKKLTTIILLLIVIATIFGIGMITKSCKTKTIISQTIAPISTTGKWKLCWKSEEKKRCGKIKKITFDKNMGILSIVAFFPSTNVTTHFWRKTSKKRGVWSQPGDRGNWTLFPTKKGGYIGEVKNYKGWEAVLIVRQD